MAVKQCAADETPKGGRVATALTSAIDGKEVGVGVVFVRKSHTCFEFILGLLKGGGHH